MDKRNIEIMRVVIVFAKDDYIVNDMYKDEYECLINSYHKGKIHKIYAADTIFHVNTKRVENIYIAQKAAGDDATVRDTHEDLTA